MSYTQSQIENAKRRYNSFMQVRTLESFEPEIAGRSAAEQRCDFHNNLVEAVALGDKDQMRHWKLFFLKDEAAKDFKLEQSKLKLAANKIASADVLAPVKFAKRLGEFGKWLNDSDNKYRSQHFNKKYTQDAVNAFLSI